MLVLSMKLNAFFDILLQVLMALDKLWHVPHFLCAYCKRELGTSLFYEREGYPYCEADYQQLFLPKCAGCGGVITEVFYLLIIHIHAFRASQN